MFRIALMLVTAKPLIFSSSLGGLWNLRRADFTAAMRRGRSRSPAKYRQATGGVVASARELI
jgi:hypothetical protein